MARLNLLAIAFSACMTLALNGSPVSAQGLIFNLPEVTKLPFFTTIPPVELDWAPQQSRDH